MERRGSDIVWASEIAAYAWCPESWRLDAIGAKPGNEAALAAGERAHTKNAAVEVQSRSAISLGWWLIVAAVILLSVLAILAARGGL